MKAPRRALALATVSALVLSGSLLPGSAGAAPKRIHRSCTDRTKGARELTMKVEGDKATGRFALPSRSPKTLVVFAHGYGHTSASWAHHMQTAANDHGVAAVAMDYRGIQISPDSNDDGLPESRGWNAMTGAEDSIAAAKMFDTRCESINRIVIMGVSMGGNMSGLSVALAGARDVRKSDGSPLFDYWFDVEGAVNLIETYTAARAAAPANSTAANAQEDIEAETGGTFEENPDAYRSRSVVARIQDIQKAKLDGAIVIHGLDDGLVPYNQGREMASLLGASQIPTHMITIGLKSKESERETTLTGHALSNVDSDYRSPLAGHASEKSTTHIVMVTAFERLWDLIEGDVPVGYSDGFVSGDFGGPASD